MAYEDGAKKKSVDEAMRSGLERATQTLTSVQAAWIASQKVVLEDGKISEYRVRMKVTFVLAD